MNESKIVSVQDVPASENKVFEEIKKISSDIMKRYFPQKNNQIIGSTICDVERY